MKRFVDYRRRTRTDLVQGKIKNKEKEEEEVWEKGKQQNDSFLSPCSFTQTQGRALSPREQSRLVIKRVRTVAEFRPALKWRVLLHTSKHTHTLYQLSNSNPTLLITVPLLCSTTLLCRCMLLYFAVESINTILNCNKKFNHMLYYIVLHQCSNP